MLPWTDASCIGESAGSRWYSRHCTAALGSAGCPGGAVSAAAGPRSC